MFIKLKCTLTKKIINTLIWIIEFSLRKAYTTMHIGENDVVDKVLNYKSKKYVLENYKDNLDKNEILIENEIDNVTPYDYLNKLLEEYKWFTTIANLNEKNSNQIINSKNIISIIVKYIITKKRFNRIKDEIKSAHIKKISISFDHITKIIAVSIPVLFLGSLMRIIIVCKAFGIKIEDIYDISDFISSSISLIIFTIIPLLVAFLVLSIAGIEDSGMDKKSIFLEHRKIEKYGKFIYIYMILILLVPVFYFKNYLYLINIITLLLIIFIPKIIHRYINNYKEVVFSIIFLVLFFSSIAYSELSNIQKYKNNTVTNKYYVNFSEDLQHSESMIYFERDRKSVV